ncbi:Uncharacterised protein [Mycobacteroides abscessus subsp. massiliense]|nr:Uncharacterised protein [Mycobacteroides abscessus subsp. massiliense]SKU05774.1 Uncharacterised protein [Mycobacteroides abscessus subsp. massiliense]
MAPWLGLPRPGATRYTLTPRLCVFRAITVPERSPIPSYRRRTMFSDPAAAAWAAAGSPSIGTPTPNAGPCARCGISGPTIASANIISEKFTGFDAWPYGTRRLCPPCAWAYSFQPTTAPAMLISPGSVTEYANGGDLIQTLATGALPASAAVVLPTSRRRHILPTAQWGHLATDGLVLRWDPVAASRLSGMAWLRTDVGATWPQLHHEAPPARLLSSRPARQWTQILNTWTLLQPWRSVPPLWAAGRILTNPPPTI